MILSDVWCCYDCVTESDQCAAAARRCIQLLLPGTQGCFTETLRLQLELWNFRYLLIYINAILILSLRHSWAFSEDLSIIGSFPTVHWSPPQLSSKINYLLVNKPSLNILKTKLKLMKDNLIQVFIIDRQLHIWNVDEDNRFVFYYEANSKLSYIRRN